MNELMNLNAGDLSSDMGKKLQVLQMQVQTLELCRQLGAHYASTDMVPKQYQGKPESAAVAIQWGMEIGLQPLQSLQNVAVVNNSPCLWGDALIAIVKGSGQCEYIRSEFDDETMTAYVATKRKGEQEEVRSYSMEDAKRAGLAGRQTYQQHPKRMLNARARSHVLRDVYADLLRGFQVREIIEEDHVEKDITPKSDTLKSLLKPTAKAEAKPEQPAPLANEDAKPEPEPSNPEGVAMMIEIINSTKSLDELNELVDDIKTNPRLNDGDRRQLRAAFSSKKKALEAEAAQDLGDMF